MIKFVPAEYIEIVWDAVYPRLVKTCEKVDFGYTPEDLKKDIEKGLRQLWITKDERGFGFAITNISIRPQGKVGVMAIGGGDDLNLTENFMPVLTDFFKNEGCVEIEMVGRQGWQKYMKRFGFGLKTVTVARKI